MAKSGGTSKSSSTKKDVIQQPTTSPRAARKLPVDTTQEYDDSNEPAGLGAAGFKEPGDPVTRTKRHQERAKASE